LPGAFTLVPTFSQIRKTTDLGEGAKNQGFSSPVFTFLKTGEVQEGVEPDVSQPNLRAPCGVPVIPEENRGDL
jgi:hypothetical protein